MSGLSLLSLNQRITTISARLNNTTTTVSGIEDVLEKGNDAGGQSMTNVVLSEPKLDVDQGAEGLVYKNKDGVLSIKDLDPIVPVFTPYTPNVFHSPDTVLQRQSPKNIFWDTSKFSYCKNGSILHIKGTMTGTEELLKYHERLTEFEFLLEPDHTRTEPYAYIDSDGDYIFFEAIESDYTNKLLDGAGLLSRPVILESKLAADYVTNPHGVYTSYQSALLTKYSYGMFTDMTKPVAVLKPISPFTELPMTINISLPFDSDTTRIISVSILNTSKTFFTYMSLYGLDVTDLHVTVGGVYVTEYSINTTDMTITFPTAPTQELRISKFYKINNKKGLSVGKVNTRCNTFITPSSDVLNETNHLLVPHIPNSTGFLEPLSKYFPSTQQYWSRGDVIAINSIIELSY